MTIILQHQFWDLIVTDHGFEVGLSFSNVPEKLHVPFDAITGFFDPSVKFGLKFEPLNQQPAEEKPAKLYPLRYQIPPPLCAEVGGKRVAIVNDAINVGSAVRGTFADLKRCQAEPVAIAALATLTPWASRFAETNGLGLEVLVSLESEVWTPTACPLCIRGEPLTESA